MKNNVDNLFKITAQTSAGIKCFLILQKVVILMKECMVGKKRFHLLGMNESYYSSSSFSCVISNFTDATVERWDMACVSIHGAVLSTVTFVLGKVTTMCQEKYFPDCCQHELLFLAELFRGQVGRGAAADTNWIGGM